MSKLTKWSEAIDENSLTLLLRYVGEFGALSSLINLETGSYPMPRTNIDAVWQLRMHGAILGMAMVYNCEFSIAASVRESDEPLFTAEYINLLAADKRTVWACELTAATYEILMWNIGEFGFRALAQNKNKYAIPKFTEHPGYDWFLRLSLYNIVRVFEDCIQRLYE